MLSLALLVTPSWAGLFNPKTTMGERPERAIDAELVQPKGWLTVGLGADMKRSQATRNAAGALVPYDDGTVWTYGRAWLHLEQGFSSRLTLYADIPYVLARLDTAGAPITTRAMGDIHTGFQYQHVLDKPWQLAFGLDLKAPSGVEWPSSFNGGAADTSSFLTGTGCTNVAPSVTARYRLGPVAPRAQVAYVVKFPTVVGYVVQTDGWGNGWLDPGDELRVTADLEAQAGSRLNLTGGIRYSDRGAFAVGTAGQGLRTIDVSEIPRSEATFLDVTGAVAVRASNHVDVVYDVAWQAMGTDTGTFAQLGLEEFSPQPGVTHGLTVEVSW